MDKFFKIIKENKDSIIKPVVVLLSICIIIPLALSLTNKITVDRIKVLEEENQKNAMSQLVKADNFQKKGLDLIDVAEPFEYYIAENSGVPVAYIFVTSSKGYGGEVSVMTAVNVDGTVKSVAILDASNETPGLGQNVTKENFYSQFTGKKYGINVMKNGANGENNEINAVTGATISSKAVAKAVDKALDNYMAVVADTGVFKGSTAEVETIINEQEVAGNEE